MSDLTEDLLTLGREWPVDTPPDFADRVITEIARPAARTRRGVNWRRWLIAVVAFLAAIAICAAVSAPVRAAIAHVFRFGGVEVHSGAGPAPAASPSLPGQHPTSLAAASDQAGFAVRAPRALGDPDVVTVSTAGVVSLRYNTPSGPVQIDEFKQDISPMFDKYTAMGAAQQVQVDGHAGYWFDDPTVTIYVGPDGADPNSARQTNGTLLWVADGITYRMDGIRPMSAAVAVAATMN